MSYDFTFRAARNVLRSDIASLMDHWNEKVEKTNGSLLLSSAGRWKDGDRIGSLIFREDPREDPNGAQLLASLVEEAKDKGILIHDPQIGEYLE